MMKTILTMIMAIMLASCASNGIKVVERMDNVDEKPSWATISKPMFKKGDKTFIVGYAEASGTANISLLNDVASNNGKNKVARYVETEMLSVFQNIAEGLEDSNSLARKFASEKSKLFMRDITEEKLYYEKVLYYQNKGEDNESSYVKTRMYVLMSIPTYVVEALKNEALQTRKPKKDVSVKTQVDKQFDAIIKDEVKEQLEAKEKEKALEVKEDTKKEEVENLEEALNE